MAGIGARPSSPMANPPNLIGFSRLTLRAMGNSTLPAMVRRRSLHPFDAERIRFLELGRQGGVRETLPGDRAGEAIDRQGAHRRTAAIGGGGERSAVDHAGAHFDTGGETVENEAAGSALEGVDETGIGEQDRKSTRLNSSHAELSRMPSSA